MHLYDCNPYEKDLIEKCQKCILFYFILFFNTKLKPPCALDPPPYIHLINQNNIFTHFSLIHLLFAFGLDYECAKLRRLHLKKWYSWPMEPLFICKIVKPWSLVYGSTTIAFLVHIWPHVLCTLLHLICHI